MMQRILILTMMITLVAGAALAENKGADLAKKLANPLAAMINVPSQLNFDENIGPDEKGSMIQLNIQPVLPFTLNEDWYLISRTIIPLTDQEDIPIKGEGESGLGDILQSLFISPGLTFTMPARYCICVKGFLDKSWSNRLSGMQISNHVSSKITPAAEITGAEARRLRILKGTTTVKHSIM
ncbi:hypothetical protein N9934_04685 [Desulfosarcina sp.]|nr:hypothetical protein [Desulfosarcina sp.]